MTNKGEKRMGNEQFLNRVIHGNCLELMQEIETSSIDMILCDLPYGTTRNKWDSVIDLENLWYEYKRIIKDRGAIVLTAQTPFDKVLGVSNLKMLKYEWIWDKKRITNPLNAKRMPLKNHENILVFYKKLPKYNPIPYKKNTVGMMSDKNIGKTHHSDSYVGDFVGGDNSNEFGYPRTIITQIPVTNNLSKDKLGLHPTQKPVALFEYLVKTYTNESETVLDNCLGSGTTAVACINTNRNFIGIEKEWEYCEIANERIKQAKEQLIQ